LSVLIIILFVVAAVFAFSRCKMSCSGYREGMQSHRLTNTHLLEDDAYGVGETSGFILKEGWPYNFPPSDKENYSDVFLCNKKCSTITSATPRANCMQDCMNSFLGETKLPNINIQCQRDGDCPGRDHVCVSPNYYGGGETGFCMDVNEPGVARIDNPSMREGFRQGFVNHRNTQLLCTQSPQSCRPGYFYNDAVGRCENRFQGVSSARAVHMSRPGPKPEISLPGSTFPGYGVGYRDPVDVPVPERLNTDR